MRTLSQQFFELKTTTPVFDGGTRIRAWHSEMAKMVPESHIQLIGSPLTVVYEEGPSIGPGLTSSYAAITKLSIGKGELTKLVALTYFSTVRSIFFYLFGPLKLFV